MIVSVTRLRRPQVPLSSSWDIL